jgi:hypothetical protein
MSSLPFPKLRFMPPQALLAAAALAAPGTALAGSIWSSVGSSGAVDELCLMAIQADNSEARLFPGVQFPCTIRYQVSDTFAGAGTPAQLALFANIRDAGAGNVVATLRRYPINGSSPLGVVVSTINSDVGGTAIGATGFSRFRQPATAVLGCGFSLDFVNNTYWIEVQMTPGALPALSNLAIGGLQVRQCFP